MAEGIRGSQLNAVGRELADDIGPYARAIASKLGIALETITPEGAAKVRAAAKDPDMLADAGKSFGAKPRVADPDAAKASLEGTAPATPADPTAIKARLSLPPAETGLVKTAPYTDAIYEEPDAAIAAGKFPTVKPGAAAGLLEASKDLQPPPPTPPIPKSASANTATPEELDALASRVKAAKGAAAVGALGAGLVTADTASKPAPPAAQAAQAGEAPPATPPAAGAPAVAPVSPSGKIDPKYVTQLPSFLAPKYDGPQMPTSKLDMPETVQIDGKEVRPLDLMKDAQDQLIASTNDLVKEYRQERDSLKQREIWEGIVQSVGLIAAGAYGMSHGLDMSGVKFSPTDWVAQQEALRRTHEALLGAEKDKFAAREKVAGAADRDLQQRRTDAEQEWGRNAKIYEVAAKAYNDKVESAWRGWQAQAKSVELGNQVQHWNAELGVQEDRISAELARAHTVAAARGAAADQKQLTQDRADGVKVKNLLERAANPKLDADQGMLLVQQARELNRGLASRGRSVVDDSVFIDKRAGNSAFQFGMGADKPGLATGSAIAQNVVKDTNTQIQAATAGTAPPPSQTAAPQGASKIVSPAKLQAYAAQHQMAPDAAATFLKSQGYVIGQ